MKLRLLAVGVAFLVAGVALADPGTAAVAIAPAASDQALAVVNWIGAHLGDVAWAAAALAGALSWLSATVNLAWLGQVALWLPGAVRFVAGNWGYAVTAVELVELYETAGPNAALARLAELAAARQPPAASS